MSRSRLSSRSGGVLRARGGAPPAPRVSAAWIARAPGRNSIAGATSGPATAGGEAPGVTGATGGSWGQSAGPAGGPEGAAL